MRAWSAGGRAEYAEDGYGVEVWSSSDFYVSAVLTFNNGAPSRRTVITKK